MPVFTAAAAAIATAVGSLFTVAGATAFVLRVAVGVGLSMLLQALAGKPKPAEGTPFGVQGTLEAGGDVPRSFIAGYGVTAGSLVYANTFAGGFGGAGGTPNALLTMVIALSDLPVRELREVWVNGELVTLDTGNPHADLGYPVEEYRVDGNDHLWVKFYDGTQTVADPYLVSTVSSASRPYESTRVGYGIAYAICTARVNQELFTGFPQYKFALYGVPLYDISKDTTAGGSGTQRWSNPATWGGDGDFLPAVQIYNLLRGVSYDGQWVYGAQQNGVGNLPSEAWIDAIESNGLSVDAPGSTTEPQFRAGGQITLSNPPADTIEALLSACHGRLAESGGVYKLKCGNPGTTSVFSFHDGNILSTEGQTFSPFFGLAESVNGITARYPEPAEGWNVRVAPPRYNEDYEVEDGGRRLLADVPLDYVPYKHQVQRLMKMALQEARRARRHTIVLPPDAQILEPLDIIDWTSERNGYEAKTFRVDGVIDKANLDVLVDVTEVNPNDYDWDPDVDFEEPAVGPVVRVPPAAQPIIDWAATAEIIKDAGGKNRRPAIRLMWDGEIEDVKAVQFAVRLKSSGEVIHRGRTDDVAAGAIIVSQGLLPATEYEVRGRYVPTGNNRATSWSSWLTVTTPDVRFSVSDLDDALQAAIRNAVGTIQNDVASIQSRLAALIAQVAATDVSNKETTRREVRRSAGNITASFSEEINAAVGPGSAIATSVTQLAAALGEIGGAANARFVVGVTPEGAIASYELETVAEGASAGFRVVSRDDGNGNAAGQVWVAADKFFVGSEGDDNTFRPIFIVDSGGEVFINGDLLLDGSITASKLNVSDLAAINANMGFVRAGRIRLQSAEGTMDLTDNPVRLLFSDNQ